MASAPSFRLLPSAAAARRWEPAHTGSPSWIESVQHRAFIRRAAGRRVMAVGRPRAPDKEEHMVALSGTRRVSARWLVVVVAVVFIVGVASGAYAARKTALTPALYSGKPPADAAAALLGAAQQLAEKGSWENIGVGRVYYLSGDKAKGQAIFDSITNGKAEGGDWIRIGRVYWEAKEWDKAKAAFDKVLQLKSDDEDWLAEIGAYYLLKGDRAHAEELFARSFQREPNSMWNALRAASAYLKVQPPG
jgi:tetratricopeptide (TPR) repeat protein